MKLFDLVWDALHNLWVRKLRTALNLVGIVISCVLLLSTLSAASGIRNSIQRFLDGSYEALRFRIVPDYDRSIEPPPEAIAVDEKMSDERRERLVAMLTQKWRRENLVRPRTLTDEQMTRLQAIESVVDVAPRLSVNCRVLRVSDPSETDLPNEEKQADTDVEAHLTGRASNSETKDLDGNESNQADSGNGNLDASDSETNIEVDSDKVSSDSAAKSSRNQSLLQTISGDALTVETLNSNLTAGSYFDQELASRVVFGEFLSPKHPDGLVIHEELAYRLGMRSDQQLADLVGKKLVIEMRHGADQYQIFVNQFMQQSPGQRTKLLEAVDAIINGRDLSALDPEALKAAQEFAKTRRESGAADIDRSKPVPIREFTVVGVFRSQSVEEVPSFLIRFLGEGQLVTHYDALGEVARELGQRQTGTATIFIDSVRNLEKVTELAKEENVATISATKTVQRMHEALDESKQSVFAVVGIILLVSAVGISNTMIISLVERSEEIGIMKAIGATNRTITRMVIFEGAVTGLLGGVIAIGITYLIAYFGNELMRAYIQQKVRFAVEGEMFCIEPWMLIGSVVIAVVVSTLASLWPARRAARMDPIEAMRGTN